ncbi:MAG: DUF2911 domain-containing protein [Candidatus Acidiferrum sp.]
MMRKRMAMMAGICLGFGLLATQAQGQADKSKRPSPPAQATCELGGGGTITVDYSSPRAKGRTIFGGLVPYGQAWRAGANEATTFVTTENLKVGGKEVPAGSYTIFTIPEEHRWTLIISKKTGEWGIPYPGEKFDFVRTEMSVSSVPEHVEDFTISFAKHGEGCRMEMTWEKTRASVTIEK